MSLERHSSLQLLLLLLLLFLQFFGPDSHECGGPLCERLMMSLEGPIYSVANAYSYYGNSATNDAGCAASTIPWGARMMGRRQDLGATIGRFVYQVRSDPFRL